MGHVHVHSALKGKKTWHSSSYPEREAESDRAKVQRPMLGVGTGRGKGPQVSHNSHQAPECGQRTGWLRAGVAGAWGAGARRPSPTRGATPRRQDRTLSVTSFSTLAQGSDTRACPYFRLLNEHPQDHPVSGFREDDTILQKKSDTSSIPVAQKRSREPLKGSAFEEADLGPSGPPRGMLSRCRPRILRPEVPPRETET